MLSALRRYWLLAVAVALVTMAGVAGAVALVPKAYTATVVLGMVPRPEVNPSGDLVRLMIPSYATLASSPTVAEDLAARFGQDPERVQAGIRAENPPTSNTVFLSVTWSDPETAAELANALADEVVASSATDPLLAGTVFAEAVPPEDPSWPPRLASLLLGGLVALAVGGGAALVTDRSRSPRSSPADVAGLMEEQGVRVPLLVTGTRLDGATVAVAGAVDARLEGNGDSRRVEFRPVGGSTSQSKALAMSTAAAISWRGRRVLLEETDGRASPADEPEFTMQSSATSPARAMSPSGPGTTGDHHHVAGTVQATEVVIASTARNSGYDTGPTGSTEPLLGVVPVLAADASRDEVRSALRAVQEDGAPLLAVVHLVMPSTTGAPASPAA